MIKTSIKQGLLTIGIATSLLACASFSVANAETGTDKLAHNTGVEHEHFGAAEAEAEARREAARAKAEVAREEAKSRLSETKLRVCEKHKTSITGTMARISDRGEKHLNLFSNISERTQEFYIKKGANLSNYEELVADTVEKKELAGTALTMIDDYSSNFDCNGDNPKALVANFKEHHKHAIEALKEYKTSVKNLIVGVKSVQGVSSSESERQ